MTEKDKINAMTEERWHAILHGTYPRLRITRKFFKHLPGHPRCKSCNAPISGPISALLRLGGQRQYSMNPSYCTFCLIKTEMGGVEIEVSMLFADIRGSTKMAAKMSPMAFTQVINRFYKAATKVLVDNDAWIENMVGDEVIALFIPGFAGKEHARLAVESAQKLLKATGHADADGPWIPIGIGVHTGIAYVGRVGSEGGISDLTAMGDAMNTAARLVSQAGPGEALISEAAYTASRLDLDGLEQRELTLKGLSDPVHVRAIRMGAA